MYQEKPIRLIIVSQPNDNEWSVSRAVSTAFDHVRGRPVHVLIRVTVEVQRDRHVIMPHALVNDTWRDTGAHHIRAVGMPRSLQQLADSIKAYERRYERATEEMIEDLQAGNVEETWEIAYWLISYERYRAVVSDWLELAQTAPTR